MDLILEILGLWKGPNPKEKAIASLFIVLTISLVTKFAPEKSMTISAHTKTGVSVPYFLFYL